MKKYFVIYLFVVFSLFNYIKAADKEFSGVTLHLSYETEADILSDFLSSANIYRYAKPGEILENQLIEDFDIDRVVKVPDPIFSNARGFEQMVKRKLTLDE